MLTPIDYFRKTISESRMIQGSWHRVENGKDFVCLAAAWGKPGTINSVRQCPTDLFPQWVFELMPMLDDGVSASEVPWLFRQFGVRADKMAAFTTSQWESLRTAFCISVMDLALEKASACQPSPVPSYWKEVVEANSLVKAALKESAARSAAWSAARSAESAAWSAARSAESAARSAESAARSAAWSAARSAESAARSAASAAWSAARSAARSAAYKEIASLLFACIDSVV